MSELNIHISNIENAIHTIPYYRQKALVISLDTIKQALEELKNFKAKVKEYFELQKNPEWWRGGLEVVKRVEQLRREIIKEVRNYE